MKSKKLFIILISVVCAIAIIFCVFAFFTVKKVDVTYAFSEKASQSLDDLKDELDGYVGKNLLFTKLDKIKGYIEKNPYFEVESITKQFPNVIRVVIKERKEAYSLSYGEKKYLLSETGIVLAEVNDGDFDTRKVVELKLFEELGVNGFWSLNLNSISVGKVINIDQTKSVDNSVSDMDRLNTAFGIARSIHLTDCVKSMSVLKKEGSGLDIQNKETYVMLETYTGVKINIWDCENFGKEKAVKAFEFYDSRPDYEKAYSEIVALENALTGELYADWIYNIQQGN